MGLVFLAEDPRLKRKLALKVMKSRPHGDEPEGVLDRFTREAEVSARLNHPNVITVFDVGEDAVWGSFLAMEYVNGCSLATLIRRARPGLEPGLMLLIQAMRALEAAAEAGIIHRDIKPENMMVSRTGQLKLMDFGLARGKDQRITATGMFLGTPSFTAPELLLGGVPSLDTDRYAFFVTAFEILFGQLPFPGRTLGETLFKVVHEAPRFPKEADPKLVEVFTVALSKDPAQRHPTLGAFLADLATACPLAPEAWARVVGQLDQVSLYGAPGEVALAPEALRASDDPTRHTPTKLRPPLPPRAPRVQIPKVVLPPPPPSHDSMPPRGPLISPRLRIEDLLESLKAPPKAQPAPAKPAPLAPKVHVHLLPPAAKPPVKAASARAKAVPPQPRSTPPADPLRAAEAAPPEPTFAFEEGPNPFDGIDWDRVLAPLPGERAQRATDREPGPKPAYSGRTSMTLDLSTLKDVLTGEEGPTDLEARAQAKTLEMDIRFLEKPKPLDA